MPNCPNTYASLHARRPCAIIRWYRTVYIPWLVASYKTHKGKRWLNSNPPNHRGHQLYEPSHQLYDPLHHLYEQLRHYINYVSYYINYGCHNIKIIHPSDFNNRSTLYTYHYPTQKFTSCRPSWLEMDRKLCQGLLIYLM